MLSKLSTPKYDFCFQGCLVVNTESKMRSNQGPLPQRTFYKNCMECVKEILNNYSIVAGQRRLLEIGRTYDGSYTILKLLPTDKTASFRISSQPHCSRYVTKESPALSINDQITRYIQKVSTLYKNAGAGRRGQSTSGLVGEYERAGQPEGRSINT